MISFFPSFFCPGSLPGHFAGKNRPSDITTPSDKSGKNARELQTHISKQQISLDQFEKHAGKNSLDDKHKHIFIPSTRKSIIQYQRITIKKKKKNKLKKHTPAKSLGKELLLNSSFMLFFVLFYGSTE